MAGLRLGPLLRYVDQRGAATVWAEADRPCTVRVRCADGTTGSSRTFQIAGHHYALVPLAGLTPGTATAYEVLLDGRPVWPQPNSRFPPSTITVPADGSALRVTFGSCRRAPEPGGTDALDALAAGLAADPEAERPDVLLLLGDQVYADSVSAETRRWLGARRDLRDAPGAQVADYEEYTRLYYESWLDPEVRWLLSTVPSCHIFDDHDVIDDWNTSAAWLAEMRATPWWQERLISGLMSYWVHQHLGNLSPAELATDPLYAVVRGTPDGTEALRSFAAAADADPAAVRWSYRRDFGRTRLLMVDTRAARVLDEERRAMLDEGEARWLREQLPAPGACDHLLIGSSLPWLLPPLIHDAEGWDAALCAGSRGPRWARFGEKLRRRADLEHWAAFPASFALLTELIVRAGSGPGAPATVAILSGDVHHAYVAEPFWPNSAPQLTARVAQLTCSPVHNSVPAPVRAGFRFGWSRFGRRLGRALARHGRVVRPPLDWRRIAGPWFGNQLMTLTLHGRSARLRLDRARRARGLRIGPVQLKTILDRPLAPDVTPGSIHPLETRH
ncbi:alkaline phosphatase D family protein [Streptomyces violascens]|uniref:Alkaline phosphatase n=1 Tax=Streptomyces violascens TaxID=67381 RepID=A0ABQ3QKJ8_9ACTN|nr:alkaline phosphatase D family protein [Streptomyces violascens]GGT93162.1 alkaline phosphatase [Streptomyces violascens]GHI37804.1 alkaline phosphatase [Streptomyces violascens]